MTSFIRLRFDNLEGWGRADHRAAFSAFRASAERLLSGHVVTGRLGIDAGAYRAAAAAALDAGPLPDGDAARRFFEDQFQPLRILPPNTGENDRQAGFVTGYYEPVLPASLSRTARFRFPLYAPPPDLVKIDDVSRPPGMDASFRFARRKSCGLLTEYHDRAAIERGALDGMGLEIAWLDSAVDAFFVHVQGSARLHLEDGREMRVGYAAKSGHPFTAIGRLLVQRGALTLAQADMDGIRGWLDAHPDEVRPLLDQNHSFIFFARTPVEDPTLGPVGAMKVPLTAMGSIAVDRELATYGVPYFISAPGLDLPDAPFCRTMIAQDTGSAILGPARADLFVGSGPQAGQAAGRVRHSADFVLLAPTELARTLASGLRREDPADPRREKSA